MHRSMKGQCASDAAVCVDACPTPCMGCCDWAAAPSRINKLRQQAWLLTAFTISWNAIEAAIAIWTGLAARSIALVGFGLDSVVEAISAVIIVWRLWRRQDDDEANERAERRAVRLIALTFFAIATYVSYDAVARLVGFDDRPEPNGLGLVLVAVSLLVMPGIAWAKRRVAEGLNSVALKADAAETLICSYLSAVVLVGLAANSLFGWWWMDPLAGLVVAGLTIREGREAWSGGERSEDDEEERAAAALVCSPMCCPACPLA